MKNNNGNPVPSIDNLIIKLRDIRNSNKNIPLKVYNELCDIEKDFIKLQNGVETNNEQPKYTEKDLYDSFSEGASRMHNMRRRTSFTFNYRVEFSQFLQWLKLNKK